LDVKFHMSGSYPAVGKKGQSSELIISAYFTSNRLYLDDPLVIVVAAVRPVTLVSSRRRHERVGVVLLWNNEKKFRRIVHIRTTFDFG